MHDEQNKPMNILAHGKGTIGCEKHEAEIMLSIDFKDYMDNPCQDYFMSQEEALELATSIFERV